MKPTKEEQIECVIKGSAAELASRYLKEKATTNSYAFLFDVTKEEIINYIKRYDLKDLIRTKPSTEDGFYAIPMKDGGYKVYEQERNIRFDQRVVLSMNDVIKNYVDYKIIGVGLYQYIK